MITPSIVFYLFFAIPYIGIMYWLIKQDKKKHAWGVTVITVIAIAGFFVSQRASRIAVQNYKQHQIDARQQEREADSILRTLNRDTIK
ncbi:hypothetical protein [Sphingobacterium chungjuense]|uniref:hypothetical protein n=1 Tax=Sphingobacterium chungjuense TaxID=2675553 RepID=UPI00140D2EC2|nr:hypothetical protein [Sphingobacterium chungjuense]